MNPPHVHPFCRNLAAIRSASVSRCGLRCLAKAVRRRLSPALVAAALLAAFGVSPATAANLLLNPSFEQNNGQFVPTSWTYFLPTNAVGVKDYWIVNPSVDSCSPHFPAQAGTWVWKQWFIHNGTNNVAGLHQTFSSSPGSIYQASGWLATKSCDTFGANCATWLQVEFLDASTNLVGLYKSANFTSAVGGDAWFQYPVTNACDLSQPVSLGDPNFTTYAVTGDVTQLVAPFGTSSVRYRYCYLTVGNEGGSALFDSAVLNQVSGPTPPVISSLFPQDTMIFVNPNDGLTFTASSPSGFTINNSGIHVTVNGTDVSGSLAITGSASSKNVAYHGLQSNLTYTASISVTDVSNLTVNANIQFQTMWFGVLQPTYLWEAEDWDFTNGMYINNPALCSAPGNPNCYFDKTGVAGTDENNSSAASSPYRPNDPMGARAAGDALRPNLFSANRADYRIDPFITGEWLNYTRDWPNSTNWVIGRISANLGDSGFLTLSIVNPDLSTTDLGKFTINGGQGYSVFQNVYLKDTNGNNAAVVLNGKQTLRVTAGGNLLPNFFMLVPGQVDLPQITGMYPTGTHPFEPTNTFSFTVAAFGSSFPAGGIRLNLDGADVTSGLLITGSASTKNVVYPSLLPNAIHVAVITATNALGHGIRLTNHFDTFLEENFMVETEDFDYDGGQYIPDSTPDAYADYNGPYLAVTNIDFQHITLANEIYTYRSTGIPQDFLGTHDWVRSNFVYFGAQDYVLVFFAGTDWANYTRSYPAGNYYAYIRSSGDGPFSMFLDRIVSGAGTTSQTTKRLGQFNGVGKDYVTYDWVPLTEDGTAPAVVQLSGVATLRLTTAGNCNPNFFMLVPASGIHLTATRSGGNIVVSFPTQAGVNYRVLYRDDLLTGPWNVLTTVLGDGTTKSATDPAAGARRFYKVVAP